MERSIRTVLDAKERGDWVETTTPDATVTEAVQQMNRHRIGSLLVMTGTEIAGIFTERDVLVRVVSAGRDPATTRVREVMSKEVVTISAAMTVREAMRLMTKRRMRHLPVVEDGSVAGLISIGDVTFSLVHDQELLIADLERYIASG